METVCDILIYFLNFFDFRALVFSKTHFPYTHIHLNGCFLFFRNDFCRADCPFVRTAVNALKMNLIFFKAIPGIPCQFFSIRCQFNVGGTLNQSFFVPEGFSMSHKI